MGLLNIFKKRPAKINVFEGKNGWYFHLLASNGKISEGSQAYSSKSNAKRAARKLFPDLEFTE